MSKKLKLEEQYQKLSHREHVLKRKNMYCGNPNTEDVELFVVDNIDTIDSISVKKKRVGYNPAFVKLFDETISNASDFHIKNKVVKNIKVYVDATSISIENDGGGIPVEIHPVEKIYVPEMIFGHLLTGENYTDSIEREGSGQNGLGVKIVNILSKKFIIETCDGKKLYKQVFKNNMSVIEAATIEKSTKKFTKVTYFPDFTQFEGIENITEEIKSILLKRVLDLAVYLLDVNFYFNDKLIKIKSFKEYMKLHLEDTAEIFYEKLDNGWEVGIAKSPNDSFSHVSICSSVSTYRGGTHVNYISLEASKDLSDMLTKGKTKVSWMDVKNKLFLFLISKVSNATFDNQCKESLTNIMTKDVHNNCKVSESLLKKIQKSEIVQSILDGIEAKEMQELKRLQKNLASVKVDKLIDAKGKDRENCVLGIFEGDAALRGVRKVRDANKFGAFPLRGKFLNVSELTASTVIKNEEVKNLISTIGIHLGSKFKEENLRYGKVYIYSDADTDGDSIASLLINFFYKYWPELFEQGRIFKVLTPLLVAIKGKEKKYFYAQSDYDEWMSKVNIKQWNIEYKKGLGALEDEEYDLIINDPVLAQLTPDKSAETNLDVWFGKDSNKRKNKLI